MNPIIATNSLQNEKTKPGATRYVRTETCSRRHGALTVNGVGIPVPEPEAEGYDPYDHAPAVPADE
jgi:hypothetical protein